MWVCVRCTYMYAFKSQCAHEFSAFNEKLAIDNFLQVLHKLFHFHVSTSLDFHFRSFRTHTAQSISMHREKAHSFFPLFLSSFLFFPKSSVSAFGPIDFHYTHSICIKHFSLHYFRVSRFSTNQNAEEKIVKNQKFRIVFSFVGFAIIQTHAKLHIYTGLKWNWVLRSTEEKNPRFSICNKKNFFPSFAKRTQCYKSLAITMVHLMLQF